jgi:hypothetical protein
MLRFSAICLTTISFSVSIFACTSFKEDMDTADATHLIPSGNLLTDGQEIISAEVQLTQPQLSKRVYTKEDMELLAHASDTARKTTSNNEGFLLEELLPLEIFTQILLYLPIKDLLRLQLVSRTANSLIQQDIFKHRIKLHYGFYLASLQSSQNMLDIKFSKNGKNWELQPHDMPSGISKFSLARFNNKLYVAYLSSKNFEVNMKSCENGKIWETVLKKTCTAPIDLELAVFKDSLWLAYISSKTSGVNPSEMEDKTLAARSRGRKKLVKNKVEETSIRLISSTNGKNWKEKQSPNISNAKRLSLVEFNNKLYLAYAIDNFNGDIYTTYSYTGQYWQDKLKTSWGTHDSLKLIAYQNELRMAHTHTHRQSIEIGSSGNGREWRLDEHFTTPSSSGLNHLTIYNFRNKLWISYSFYDSQPLPKLIISETGRSWTEIEGAWPKVLLTEGTQEENRAVAPDL